MKILELGNSKIFKAVSVTIQPVLLPEFPDRLTVILSATLSPAQIVIGSFVLMTPPTALQVSQLVFLKTAMASA